MPQSPARPCPAGPDTIFFHRNILTGAHPLRIAEWRDVTLPLDTLEHQRASHPASAPLLHLTQLKGFMDGSLGSRAVALAGPYADDPGNSGLPRFSQSDLDRLTSACAAAGFQIGFHAIGDGANNLALNAFSAAEPSGNRPTGLRRPLAVPPHRHPAKLPLPHRARQVLLPEDFDRFVQIGVIASMQPSHLLTDMAVGRPAPRRRPRPVPLHPAIFPRPPRHPAFGTDYPVESIDPFRGL